MNEQFYILTVALLLGCNSSEPSDGPSGECRGVAFADEALGDGALDAAREHYEASRVADCAEKARSGLVLLNEHPTMAAFAGFLRSRQWGDRSLDILLARYAEDETSKSLLCRALGESVREAHGSLVEKAHRQGQYVVCLREQEEPDSNVELAALTRLASIPASDVLYLTDERFGDVATLYKGCLQAPGKGPAEVTLSCDDPFPVGELARLSMLAANALDGVVLEGVDEPQGSVDCLLEVGMNACLRALAEGCACDGWQVLQPGVLLASEWPGGADRLRVGLYASLDSGTSSWSCLPKEVEVLAKEPLRAQAVRLFHIALAQKAGLAGEPICDPEGSGDLECARQISCEIGDLSTLASFFPECTFSCEKTAEEGSGNDVREPVDVSGEPGGPSNEGGRSSGDDTRRKRGSSRRKPRNPTQEPGDSKREESTQELGDSSREPGGSTREPGDSTREPGDSTRETGDSMREPTQEPGGSTREPGGSTWKPGGSTRPEDSRGEPRPEIQPQAEGRHEQRRGSSVSSGAR